MKSVKHIVFTIMYCIISPQYVVYSCGDVIQYIFIHSSVSELRGLHLRQFIELCDVFLDYRPAAFRHHNTSLASTRRAHTSNVAGRAYVSPRHLA